MPRHLKQPGVADRVTHTSNRQTWMTPRWILDLVYQLGPIALDPCASDDEHFHFAQMNFTKKTNGLVQHWQRGGLVFVNHEYGRGIPEWCDKCATEACHGAEIVQLCPARPGANWYMGAKRDADALCELNGRVLFDEHWCKDPAPFPSALFYYGDKPYLFCHIFVDHGEVRILS